MNITITIAGPLMSGKSTIAQVIKEALDVCEIDTSIQSIKHNQPFCSGAELKWRLRNSGAKPKVLIKEVQTKK